MSPACVSWLWLLSFWFFSLFVLYFIKLYFVFHIFQICHQHVSPDCDFCLFYFWISLFRMLYFIKLYIVFYQIVFCILNFSDMSPACVSWLWLLSFLFLNFFVSYVVFHQIVFCILSNCILYSKFFRYVTSLCLLTAGFPERYSTTATRHNARCYHHHHYHRHHCHIYRHHHHRWGWGWGQLWLKMHSTPYPAYSHQSYGHHVGICHNVNYEGWWYDTVTFPPYT